VVNNPVLNSEGTRGDYRFGNHQSRLKFFVTFMSISMKSGTVIWNGKLPLPSTSLKNSFSSCHYTLHNL